MRKLLLLLLSLVFVVLAACGGNGGSESEGTPNQSQEEATSPEESETEESTDPITVGIVIARTGPFAELGREVIQGFELYLEQNDGKLAGREVNVVVEDGEGDPQVSLRKYRQVALNNDADFIIAGDSSAVLYALRDEIEKDPRIMFVPISAGLDISWEQKSEYIFRLGFSNWQGGHAAGQYAANSIGKKAITITADYPGGEEAYDSFKAAYEANGGQIVEEFRPPMGATDYASYINQMSQIDADVVYAFLVGSDSVRFLNQFTDMGMKERFELISPFSFGEITVVDAAGEAALQALCATPYSPWLENDVNPGFVEAYEAKYNELPTNQSAAGYDIAQAIEKVLEEVGTSDPEQAKEVLKGLQLNSPRGPITIDPNTHDPIQNFYITRNVQGEDRIVLEIEETFEQVQVPAERPAQ